MNDQDQEVPLPDPAEQQEVIPADGPLDSLPPSIPLEASEADVAEQARALSLEEDDYR